MEDCLFCKIIAGQIPSSKVYEDEYVYAFRDINPQAAKHVLVIPKAHVSGLNEFDKLPAGMGDKLLTACAKIAQSEGIAESGYRIVSNCGSDACQSVKHLHIHLLGGQKLGENMA